MPVRLIIGLVTAVCLLGGCSLSAAGSLPSPQSASAPETPSTPPVPERGRSGASGVVRPDHVVVVVLENHSFDEVLRSQRAPYLRQLAHHGAALTQFYAVTHPSQPNYLALFSGSTQGIRDDSCPHNFDGPDLGSELRAVGDTFVGYSESLPRPGWPGCAHGDYVRKHAPWVDFRDLPGASSVPMTDFPTDYAQLPTVSFVIPNLQHDMHDGTLEQADVWVQTHLSGYVSWARTHNSVLILTADEDDKSNDNVIPALLIGQHIRPGNYPQHYTLYSLLRTIEDWYDLPHLGAAASATPIHGIGH